MDNPIRMMLTETWETKEDPRECMNLGESEAQDGWLAQKYLY